MDTLTEPGKSSRIHSSAVRPANWNDLEEFDGELLALIDAYFVNSNDEDKDSKKWLGILWERVRDDRNFLLVLYFDKGSPKGLLSAEFLPTSGEAKIIMGYLPQKLDRPSSSRIVDQAMDYFDRWSKIKKAKSQVFYTRRAPGSHKLMLNRGWKHDITIYRKELAP